MLKNAQFVHILIKNDTKQRLSVVFSILMPMFHKLCVLEQPPPHGCISFTLSALEF